jgi:hypothetical protein
MFGNIAHAMTKDLISFINKTSLLKSETNMVSRCIHFGTVGRLVTLFCSVTWVINE